MDQGSGGRRGRQGEEHPPLAMPVSAAEGRRHVWHLFFLALVTVALPLALGGYALRQAATSQRVLLESNRLAQADVLAAHVSGAILDLRKDIISLTRDSGTAAALSLNDKPGGVKVLDTALSGSRFFGSMALLDSSDALMSVSPGTAGEVFSGIATSDESSQSITGLKRVRDEFVWVMRFTVRDVRGKRVGSLAAAISLSSILRAENPGFTGKTQYASLVDTEGHVLASTDVVERGNAVTQPQVLGVLASGKRAIVRHHSDLRQRTEVSAMVPVVQAPFFAIVGQAAEELDAPLAMVSRWLWIGFLALTLSSAGMFWHALRTFRHYDLRLVRECSLATGVIEGTSDMVFVKDSRGRYLLVNEPGAHFLGHSREEIVGQSITDVMAEQDAEQTRKNDREVLESGRPTKREFSGTDLATGKPYVVWTARHPLRDKKGAVAAVVAVSRDVTERHRLIAALREGEQKLRLITDSLPALIAYVDKEERYRFVNARLVDSLGAGSPSPLGRTVREVSGDSIYAEQREHLVAALNGERVTFEGRFSIRGRQQIFRSTYVPDVGPDGEIRGFYAMTFDITDFKTIETLLAANEAKLRLIADNIPVMVSYIDRDRRFQFNNAAYAKWLGRPLTEITGRLLSEVLDPRLRTLIEPQLNLALEGQPVEFEFASPQSHREFHGSYIPDYDAFGHTVGVYGVIHDITDQKRIEHALRQEAHLDTLTGLMNRRPFMRALKDAMSRSERSGVPVAVMFLDLDHLKSINDRFGHQVGDLALQEFARRLSASVRSSDTVARIAGDEFVILLDAMHEPGEAALVADKISAAVQAPFILEDKQIVLSASTGVAIRRSGEIDPAQLIVRADAAMYSVKRTGRGGFQVDS